MFLFLLLSFLRVPRLLLFFLNAGFTPQGEFIQTYGSGLLFEGYPLFVVLREAKRKTAMFGGFERFS